MTLRNASGANVEFDTEENVEEIRQSRKRNAKWTTELGMTMGAH
ncbi:hypothetical protein L195_g041288, partial [Trifolium pratense]